MNQIVYIYTLCCPLTGLVRYVGKTNSLRLRFFNHIADQKSTPKAKWIQSLIKNGLKPQMEVIEICECGNWKDSEHFWITYLRFMGLSLLNVKSGGGGGRIGMKRSIHQKRNPDQMRLMAIKRWKGHIGRIRSL